MNYDYNKRSYLLPEGCKDLSDVWKLEAKKPKEELRQILRTNEEIRQVFRRYFPEIAAGTVEIVSLAREVGRRCCLAVRSHDPKVSAVEACSLGRGERRTAMVAELGGELPTVLLWQASPEQFIKNAFTGATSNVVLDSATRQAVVMIDRAVLKIVMRGKDDPTILMTSQLTGLVSEITGWKIILATTGND